MTESTGERELEHFKGIWRPQIGGGPLAARGNKTFAWQRGFSLCSIQCHFPLTRASSFLKEKKKKDDRCCRGRTEPMGTRISSSLRELLSGSLPSRSQSQAFRIQPFTSCGCADMAIEGESLEFFGIEVCVGGGWFFSRAPSPLLAQ